MMGDFIRATARGFVLGLGPEEPVERRGRRRNAPARGAASFVHALALAASPRPCEAEVVARRR
jgi:hypothetical protein